MSNDILITYKFPDGTPTDPLPHQQEFHLYTGWSKHHLLAGSLGTGKTEAMCMEAIQQSAAYENNLGLMGRKVLDAFKKSTLIQLLDLAGGFVSKHRSQDREIIFKNGSRIVYMALDDSRDSIQRIKSMNLGWYAFDQLEEVSEQTFIAAAGQLRKKGVMRCSFHTCNPAGHDWVWKKFKQHKKKQNETKGDYRLIETRTWTPDVPPPETDEEVKVYSDNPHLPADYIKHLLSMPPMWVNRYVYCSWDDFAGLVYPMFDEKVHVIKPFEMPKWWNRYVVYDYGYKNPTCILFAAVDDEKNIFVYDIIYGDEMRIDELVPMVEDRLETGMDYEFIADPSINRTERDGYSIADEWEEYGIQWERANNDKRAGFDRVARYLTTDKNGHCQLKFFDVRNMGFLLDEMMDYKWKELKHGHSEKSAPEEPVKKNDHAMDCVRYLVHAVEGANKPKRRDSYRTPSFFRQATSWMGT